MGPQPQQPAAAAGVCVAGGDVRTRVCLVVEGSTALAQHWERLRGDYLEPLLRAIDKGHMGACELALIVFQTRSEYRCAPVCSVISLTLCCCCPA